MHARAGADIIISYWATEAAGQLRLQRGCSDAVGYAGQGAHRPCA